jgi:subtilase family serine protease
MIRVKNQESVPDGYAPKDLWTAYNVTPSAVSGGPTVAIVDAFIDPNLQSDLAHYRAYWGLPPCTSSNGCFTEVDLGTSKSVGWGQEESMDVDMVSALCPACSILLVAAKDQSNANLLAAEQYATSHAQYVSNSWDAGREDQSLEQYDHYFEVPGVLYTVASGDGGYQAPLWPSVLPSVVAVGGTNLITISPRYETAWGDSTSGCSTIYPRPAFQSSVYTDCSMRAVVDISADAGYPVTYYDTYQGTYICGGWCPGGGTSQSTPMIAALFADAQSTVGDPQLYPNESLLYDITQGSNGNSGKYSCDPLTVLCNAGPGWDGPSGLGAPNGLTAFSGGDANDPRFPRKYK